MKDFIDFIGSLEEDGYQFFYETSMSTKSARVFIKTDDESHVLEVQYTSNHNGELLFDHMGICEQSFDEITNNRINLMLEGFASACRFVYGKKKYAKIKRQIMPSKTHTELIKQDLLETDKEAKILNA